MPGTNCTKASFKLFFNQFLWFRLWLVIFSIVSGNFVAIVFSSIFLYWYSHSCKNQKSNFVKTLFVNLMTVPVFYCRYVIDKDVPESFYKQSLLLVEYSLSIYIDIYIYVHIYIFQYKECYQRQLLKCRIWSILNELRVITKYVNIFQYKESIFMPQIIYIYIYIYI